MAGPGGLAVQKMSLRRAPPRWRGFGEEGSGGERVKEHKGSLTLWKRLMSVTEQEIR
jgi:hypothetical protein